ncbi:Cdc6/Cdc18 family protein [Halobacterium hubeiense]|uniref:Cdc6/Cdc18 family protein n=1 Tax=Halobacterium hubeiense TaxID=1407499 RepID=UPI003C76E4E3
MLRNARVLRPEFVPGELQHRDHEHTALTEALKPLTRGERADPVIITGPTGVGKTHLTKFALERLQESEFGLETAVVNCWQNYSGYRALFRILEHLGRTLDVHRQSTPQDELVERLRDYEGSCVIVLDEADQLEDKGIIYDLRRMPQFTLILIANREEDLFADLDDRLQSRLHGTRTIHFESYGIDELTAILQSRADAAFSHPDPIATGLLEEIADAAAGDARVAITMLREAAKNADREGHDQITAEDVAEAIPEGRQAVRDRNLETLKPTQRTLYAIIEAYVSEHGEPMPPSDLYAEYEQRADDPVGNRQVRRHLNKLDHYELVSIKGSSRDRRYDLASQASH